MLIITQPICLIFVQWSTPFHSPYHPLYLMTRHCVYFLQNWNGKADTTRHEVKESGGYACSKCKRSFTRRKRAQYHEKHCGIEVKCVVCEKMLKNKESLRKHMEGHTVEHKCHRCSKGFSSQRSLMRHQVTKHSGVKVPLQCEHCDAKYSTPSSMKRHCVKAHKM